MIEKCPHCEADLQGEPIPQKYRDAGYYAAGSTHYRREIGYSAHDYIQFWICPDCDGTWNRWADDHGYWERAEKIRMEYEGAQI
jgi:hypothetical protein